MAHADESTHPQHTARADEPPRAAETDPGTAPETRTVWWHLLGIVVAAPVVVGLAVLVFTWPAARTQPRDVPVGVVGSGAAADQAVLTLARPPGAYRVLRYGTPQQAVTALHDRDVVAAVVAAPGTEQVLVASANGPALLRQIQPTLMQAAGPGATVDDVVPTPTTDPQGSVISQSVLPLTLAGEFSAILLVAVTRPGWHQLVALAVVSVFTGLLTVLLVGAWLDVLGPGRWWLDAGVVALQVLAVGSIVLGLRAAIGKAGPPVAVALLVFIGNGFSGISSSPSLLPRPVRLIGSWLPPGAGDQLLRSTAFFAGHDWVAPTVVLLVWTAVGAAAALVHQAVTGRPGARAHVTA